MSSFSSFNLISHSDEMTRTLGFDLGKIANKGHTFGLTGGLGAGKTVFTKGFAAGLGIEEEITSPTYSIIQEYPHSKPFIHMDWYRMSGEEDLFQIGVEEYLDGQWIVLVEWASHCWEMLPQNTIRITISIQSGTHRNISISIPKEFTTLVNYLENRTR